MKKVLILLLAICIVLTGCEKNTNEEPETNITKEMNDKIDLFLKIFPYKYTNVTSKNVSEKDKMFMGFYIASETYYKDYVSRDELNKSILETFGKHTKYNDKDIMSIFTDETIAFYDKDKGQYTYNVDTAHGVCSITGDDYEISRTRRNNYITVKLKRVYYGMCDVGIVTEIYKNPDLKEQYEDTEEYARKEDYSCATDEDGKTICEIDTEAYIKEHLDDIPTLTFKFKLENDIPVFRKVY